MCFVPIISLSTALIEFSIAIFILYYFKKSKFKNSMALFITFLGLYQLSEYFICTSSIPITWGKIGFIAYTFLPALGLKIVLEHLNIIDTKKLINNIKIFIIPVFFSIFALIKDNFIGEATCKTYFILLYTVFSETYPIKGIYIIFYEVTVLSMLYLLFKYKNKTNKKITFWLCLTFLISLIPAILLLIIFPSIYYTFPSVYCQLSILSTFCLLRVLYLEKKK